MIEGHQTTLPVGTKGFDVDQPLDVDQCKALVDAGYRFAIRYLRRLTVHEYDLSAGEANLILMSGLALMCVQHVESEEAWTPSARKGYSNGQSCTEHAKQIGLPPGMLLWCDLEGVAQSCPPADTIAYCNSWHAQVAAAGYLPGLYVGWHSGLTATQLYRALRFTHYWAAYNLNADQYPAVRGVQLRQYECTDQPLLDLAINDDVAMMDRLGSAPPALSRWVVG